MGRGARCLEASVALLQRPLKGILTDRSVKRGVTYSYKTVAVNAKGQQSKASAKAVVKIKKH